MNFIIYKSVDYFTANVNNTNSTPYQTVVSVTMSNYTDLYNAVHEQDPTINFINFELNINSQIVISINYFVYDFHPYESIFTQFRTNFNILQKHCPFMYSIMIQITGLKMVVVRLDQVQICIHSVAII